MNKKVLSILGTLFLLVSCASNKPEEPVKEPEEQKQEEPVPHTHTYADVYSYDDTTHWKAATCEHTMLKTDESEHTFTNDKCNICGFEREPVVINIDEKNRISNIKALEQTYSDICGVVIAVNGDGTIISDGTDACYIYGHTEFAVGDFISVSGKYTAYKGVNEFEKASVCTKLEESAPEIRVDEKELTVDILTTLSSSTNILLPLVKYKWNSQVALSGTYKVFNIEGCDVPIEMPKLSSDPFNVGNYYDISAYFYGKSTSSGGYYCFMLDKATLTKEDVLQVHTCGHVCPKCGKCTDATCTNPICSQKCTCVEVSETALVIDFSIAGNPEGIVAKTDSSLDEKTFTYNNVTYGYKGCCKNDTQYGAYLFMLGKDKAAQTCFYNKTEFEKEIKSITIEPTSSASTKVKWCISLGNSMMDSPVESTNQQTGKTILTVQAGEGSFKYFNLSTLDASNNLQVKTLIIEFK